MAEINAAAESDTDFFDKVDVIVAPPMLHVAAVMQNIHPSVKVRPPLPLCPSLEGHSPHELIRHPWSLILMQLQASLALMGTSR